MDIHADCAVDYGRHLVHGIQIRQDKTAHILRYYLRSRADTSADMPARLDNHTALGLHTGLRNITETVAHADIAVEQYFRAK